MGSKLEAPAVRKMLHSLFFTHANAHKHTHLHTRDREAPAGERIVEDVSLICISAIHTVNIHMSMNTLHKAPICFLYLKVM